MQISSQDVQLFEELLQQGQAGSPPQATGLTIETPAVTVPRQSIPPQPISQATRTPAKAAQPAPVTAKPAQTPPAPQPTAKTPAPRATGKESYWSLLLTGMGWAFPSFAIVQVLKSACKFWATNPLALPKTSVGWYLGNVLVWFLMTPLVWITIAFLVGMFVVWTDNSSRTTITRQRFQILMPILGYLLALAI